MSEPKRSLHCDALKPAGATASKRYFTGEPCLHGHVAERYVINRACVVCLNGYSKRARTKLNQVDLWAQATAGSLRSRSWARKRKRTVTTDYVRELLKAEQAAGRFLTWEPNTPSAPSLDRIDNAEWYIEGNVRIVPLWYNMAKNSWTDEQLQAAMRAAGWTLKT